MTETVVGARSWYTTPASRSRCRLPSPSPERERRAGGLVVELDERPDIHDLRRRCVGDRSRQATAIGTAFKSGAAARTERGIPISAVARRRTMHLLVLPRALSIPFTVARDLVSQASVTAHCCVSYNETHAQWRIGTHAIAPRGGPMAIRHQ